MNDFKVVPGGVVAAKGFLAAGCETGIRHSHRKDMGLVYSEAPCVAAGTFTSNVVKAAPVLWDKRIVEESAAVHAVVVNSGIANACTGREGMEVCEKTADAVAAALNVAQDAVLIGSTGVIGMQIPMDKITYGVNALQSALQATEDAAHDAADAIITTDTHRKELAVSFTINGTECHLGGMCKGSGMIHPNMCTMLAFLTSDVAIEKSLLQKALRAVVVDTFNMISVDGDMSTNDTLLVLCNGAAGNKVIDSEDADYETFVEALTYICAEMAQMLAGDGEGATALFETRVVNAASKEDARTLAKSVIGSSLTKAAIFGHDANWGRILCALGYSGADFDPEAVDLFIESDGNKMQLFGNGSACDYSEEEATKILSAKKVTVTADMHMGTEEATAWGCDLTYDYVKINADYRS